MRLNVSTAPHLHTKNTVHTIMRDVLIALAPTTIFGVYAFGMNSALLVVVSVVTAVLSEYVWQKLAKRPVSVSDLSAAVTGLILALNLPPNAPWWIAVIGSVFAIIIVKQLFGGLGDNFLNPALAARAVLLASFPARMTGEMLLPTFFSSADAVTSATPLAGGEFSMMDMFLGNIPGTIGEVCKVAILLGFIYLLVRRIVKWHIPVIFTVTSALLVWLFSGLSIDPLTTVLSGGLLFGAVFMATDYTTNPMTTKGEVVFAIGCGLILAIIRCFGSYPEGVTYAILLMNIATPLIDKYMKPKRFGEAKANA